MIPSSDPAPALRNGLVTPPWQDDEGSKREGVLTQKVKTSLVVLRCRYSNRANLLCELRRLASGFSNPA